MAAEIVDHDDVAWLERRDQHLPDLSAEQRPIDRAIDHTWRGDGVVAQRGEERQRAPAPVWRIGAQPLPPWAPTTQRCHVGLDPGLIDEDEAGRIKLLLHIQPATAAASDIGAQLLSREPAFY